ncbi:hypothetical protein [Hyphomonas oceanitis]
MLRAPWPVPAERVGGRTTFEIHHVTELQFGGSVYD